MSNIFIKPEDYPPQKGESWWIVHPNNGNVEFSAPVGGLTVCTKDFQLFKKGTAYSVSFVDEYNGYISIKSKEDVVNMPFYLFARYFDAEAFVRPIKPAKPFVYTVGDKDSFAIFND